MWPASSRRLFLLQLKAKYAGKHPVTRQHSLLSNNMSIIIDNLFCILFLLFVGLCFFVFFSDGQKKAKKFEVQIRSETLKIKSLKIKSLVPTTHVKLWRVERAKTYF